MRRASITALIALGIAVSSWQGWKSEARASLDPAAVASPGLLAARAELPPVSAGPAARSEPRVATQDPTAVAVLAFLEERHTALSGRDLERLADTIVREAARNELDPWLVLAVIEVESRCYHLAVSPVGALGLMQLLPATAEEVAHREGVAWHGPETLFDPFANVQLGTAYLRELAKRFGSVSTALAAYNWGPGRIRSRLRKGHGLPSIYIGQVMKAYEDTPRQLASAG